MATHLFKINRKRGRSRGTLNHIERQERCNMTHEESSSASVAVPFDPPGVY